MRRGRAGLWWAVVAVIVGAIAAPALADDVARIPPAAGIPATGDQAPVRFITLNQAGAYVEVALTSPELAGRRLTVTAVVANATQEVARGSLAVANGEMTSRRERLIGGQFELVPGGEPTQVPGRLRVAVPSVTERDGDQVVYVVVDEQLATGPVTWRSSPYRLHELRFGGRVDLVPWTWKLPSSTERWTLPTESASSLQLKGTFVSVVIPSPPTSLDGRPVSGVDDVVLARPLGVDDPSLVFELRVDSSARQLTAYRPGDETALPIPPQLSTTSGSGVAGTDRRGPTGQPVAPRDTPPEQVGAWTIDGSLARSGEASYLFSGQALGWVIGRDLDQRSQLELRRTLHLADGTTVPFGSVSTHLVALDASSAPASVSEAGQPSAEDQTSDPRFLVGAVVVAAIAASVIAALAARRSHWWRRRRARRQHYLGERARSRAKAAADSD